MATYTGIKKIKIGNNVFELAVDWSNVTSKPTIPTNTDEKVKTVALTSGTNYYPVLATGANAAANRQVDSTLGGLQYKSTAGTTSTVGTAYLGLGNATASGTANNERGGLQLYSPGTYYTLLVSGNNTANRTISLPNEDGVVLLGELGYTTNGLFRAVQRDSNGKLFVAQQDQNTDTKNTAGSSNTSSKIYLIGATSQAANPQTYSHDTAYVNTNGSVYSEDMTTSDITSFVNSLEVTGGNTAVDVVVDQGTMNNPSNVPWWYRKWSSGLLETGCYYTGNTTAYSSGSGFGFYNTTFTFPTTLQPVDTNYIVYADLRVGSGHAFYTGTVGTKTLANFKIFYGSTVTSGTVIGEFWIFVRAKWK